MKYKHFFILALIILSVSEAKAADYTHGDACSAAGAWHHTNDANSNDFLVCNGTNWLTAWSAPIAGNILRLDDNPALGNAGCFRYNGTTGRVEYSHDCTSYSVFGDTIWNTGTAEDIYYDPGGTPQVGIGNNSPIYALDVVGEIRSSEYIVLDATAGAATPTFFAGGGGGGLWTSGAGDDIYYNTGTHRVGIGTTTPSVELDIDGDIEYTGVITDVSDRRLKTDIEPLNAALMLEKIKQIDAYSFKMKDNVKAHTEMGVMAQDMEEIFPTLVKTTDDEMRTKSVNYIGLIGPLIEAVKEQQAHIEKLQNEIDLLKQQNQPVTESP